MPDNFTDWVQLDTIRTRERFDVQASNSGSEGHSHTESNEPPHNGEIEYVEWEAETFFPALDRDQNPASEGESPTADQRASFVLDTRWLVTPLENIFGFDVWESQFAVSGSAIGLVDFDPLWEWEAEARAAALAEFDASAPPGVLFRYLEWQVNPFVVQPWGLHTNRTVEVDLAYLDSEERGREGDPIGDGPTDPLTHGLITVPNVGGETDPHDYGYDDDAGLWASTVGIEARQLSLADSATTFDILTLAAADGETRVDIDDAYWAANHWPVARTEGLDDYTNHGLPLLLAPAFAFTAEDPFPGEHVYNLSATAAVYLESDFTPPPYRIVYQTADTRPALRHYPRDPDGRGWGGVTRHYPPARSRRGYGGARQP